MHFGQMRLPEPTEKNFRRHLRHGRILPTCRAAWTCSSVQCRALGMPSRLALELIDFLVRPIERAISFIGIASLHNSTSALTSSADQSSAPGLACCAGQLLLADLLEIPDMAFSSLALVYQKSEQDLMVGNARGKAMEYWALAAGQPNLQQVLPACSGSEFANNCLNHGDSGSGFPIFKGSLAGNLAGIADGICRKVFNREIRGRLICLSRGSRNWAIVPCEKGVPQLESRRRPKIL